MSAFLSLTDVVRDALLSTPALAGGRVRRGRAVSVQAEEASAITVNLARSRATELDLQGQALQWETAIVVSFYARASAGQDGEAAIDPLLVSTWGRLYAITPPAGVVGITLDPAIQWDVDEADTTVVSASLTLRITHITTTAELAAT